MKEKKPWITPTVELLSRGYVEGGHDPNVHEKTGHASINTPNNHANEGPFFNFFDTANNFFVANFTRAQSS
jgi:hypothetical protein